MIRKTFYPIKTYFFEAECDKCVKTLNSNDRCYCASCYQSIPEKEKIQETKKAINRLFDNLEVVSNLINSL